jgi:uncharacterized membrane protein YtjA (UPF0391 family)
MLIALIAGKLGVGGIVRTAYSISGFCDVFVT